jgi:hairy and enhancer of split related with YRPW motif
MRFPLQCDYSLFFSPGLDTFAYDPQRYAMDYHSIGFRECASEVARYLVSCEGLDIQDPLRLRLMSHLQCFAAQRELASKSCSTPYPHAYPGYPPPQTGSAQPYPHAHAPLSAPPAPHVPIHDHHQGYAEGSVSSIPPSAPPVTSSSSYAPPSHAPTSYHHSGPPPPHHQYPQSGSKPYRPWGAELAY